MSPPRKRAQGRPKGSVCRRCRRPIKWGRSTRGGWWPLEPTPVGNCRGYAGAVMVVLAFDARGNPKDGHVASTGPDADRWAEGLERGRPDPDDTEQEKALLAAPWLYVVHRCQEAT